MVQIGITRPIKVILGSLGHIVWKSVCSSESAAVGEKQIGFGGMYTVNLGHVT